MRISLVLRPLSEERMQLAKQIGVTDIDTVLPADQQNGPVWNFNALVQHRKRIDDAGLFWSVVESVHIPDRVKLGQEGRDEDIADYCQTIRNLGAAGVPIMCYNWMPVFNWLRTSVSTRTRGGALATSYDHDLMKDAPLTEHGEVSEDLLWETLEYFLKRVIPVAEEAGVKQAMHPDDPPLSPIRGIARIMTSVENFERALDIVPSDYNGVTFCQGNFAAMGANVPNTIRRFGKNGKIHFAHFRDIKGTVPRFEEAFHDDGDSDMAECMRAYRDVGFEGPIRPDHVPTIAGEPNDPPGYTLLGRLYAVGYMKGLLDGIA